MSLLWDLIRAVDDYFFFYSLIKSTMLVGNHVRCLYNKQNNTWLLLDIEFLLLVFNSISHSFAALTCEISC